MAKGKKASGKHYISKGERPNVNKKICNAVRQDYLANLSSRRVAQVNAWRAGKNVMVTIPNPNTKQTNRQYIRVPAKELWGDPRNRYMMKSGYLGVEHEA